MASKRIDFISIGEFQKLYKAEKDRKMKLAMLLMFGSGLRISEVLGLEKEITSCCSAEFVKKILRKKISGKKRKAYFCQTCNKEVLASNCKRKKGEWKIQPLTSDKIDLKTHQIRIDMAKGNKWRIVPTSPALREDMLRHLPLKIARRTFNNRLKALSQKIIGKPISPHTLRHGCANHWVNDRNIPLPMVQQMLGHSKLETTGIYTKANPVQAVNRIWESMNENN